MIENFSPYLEGLIGGQAMDTGELVFSTGGLPRLR
jgi:hypothetical protein